LDVYFLQILRNFDGQPMVTNDHQHHWKVKC